MDLASVVAALASVGVRVSGSNPNNNIQEDSSRACPTGLAGPEPSGTHIDPGQHFHLLGGFSGWRAWVGVSFVPCRSCLGRVVCGPVWAFLDARLCSFVFLAGVCSCLVWGGQSITGPGSLFLWCGGPSLTWVFVRPCLPREAVPSAVGDCLGVAVGGCFPPPCFCFQPFR